MLIERGFEFATKIVGGQEMKQFEEAKLPEYSTKYSVGADFFCAEDVEIPSIWTLGLQEVSKKLSSLFSREESDIPVSNNIRPTMIHTGVKVKLPQDEVLELYNRSSNAMKRGLVLANSVGIIDPDYYTTGNEIMFGFYNFLPFPIVIMAGERIGQGIFKKVLKPTFNYVCSDSERTGGFGSTGV